MGMVERDPRDMRYVALYIAIKWYQEITPEAAIRIAEGGSHTKPGVKLTPKAYLEIKKIIDSPNFYNIDNVARQFRVNKYDVLEALSKEKFKDKIYYEGVITISQIDIQLKKLKDKAENCNGASCEKMFLK